MAEQQPSDFPAFERLAGDTLIGWGLASVLAGALGLATNNTVLRQASIQAIAWGAIDAAIGLFGRRSATRHAADPDQPARARRFRLIVLVNAALDVGYVAAGLTLIRRSAGKPARTGMGLGILSQGLFLLLFDCALAWLSGTYTRRAED
ncbi:MAG TPA: hypothetical protein VFS21_08760 [Roseiflexaceae bacterium]|nr:hypothetical protein [Roseiflexaceae bacterium]